MNIQEYEELFGLYKPEESEDNDFIIRYPTKEECENLIKKHETTTLYDEYYCKPVYATKSNLTKRQAEFLFVHQGQWMNEWKLEMLLENGYGFEANDKWNSFIRKLLNDREITLRQYNNWLDRFKH